MDPSLVTALDAADVAAASRWIETEDDPLRVVAMYHGAIRHLYWSRKDLASLVDLGRLAIDYARRTADADRGPLGSRVLAGAKAIAYDIGSFTWPGWDEPGIAIGSSELRAGAEAAELNRRLTEELGGDEAAAANAHWLTGAHALARGDHAAARSNFERAAAHAAAAGQPGLETMTLAYATLSDAAAGVHGARDETMAAIEGLEAREDGRDYVDQLRDALRIFAG